MDGHLQPLNTKSPCVWVAQPWSAVAVKREYASTVQLLLENLNHNNASSWENALLSLLETYHVNIKQLDNTIPISDYLEQATGFASAYSFPSCNPPRSIVYCTTSLIEHTKCSWLQEVASVNGIEPNIQCVRENNLETCMNNINYNIADVVFVDESQRLNAEQLYNLRPILYEYAKQNSDRYTVLAVVKTSSDIYNFSDLYKKRACLPSFEGAAYLSVLETIRHSRGVFNDDQSYLVNELTDFFDDDSCTWTPNTKKCKKRYSGDEGALLCLKENQGDVAFVDMAVFQKFISSGNNITNDYKLICPFGRSKSPNDLCYLHWSSRGYLMIHNNQTNVLRRNEIYNSLRDMDHLFGKYYESHILPFSMFGPFDRKNNVMFHDQTEALRGIIEMQKDRTPRFLESTISNYSIAQQRYQRTKLKNSATAHDLGFPYVFLVIFTLTQSYLVF